MRTPTLTALPTEPLESALVKGRDVALVARDKGLELLESDKAQELLRRGHTVAIVARDRGSELLDSDAAHEILRRGRGVVSAARGELIAQPTKSRKPLGLVLFAVGAAAGVAAAFVAKRMATTPPAMDLSYDDPAAQFPTKGGVIDLTSVAAEEGLTNDPAAELEEMGDVGIGTETGPATTAAAPATTAATATSGATSSTNGTPGTATKVAPEASRKKA